VGECSSRTRAECIENYFGVTCRDDAQAEQCATNLAAATCSTAATAVAGCDLSDVADPAPAVAACNSLLTAVCNHDVNCGANTLEACLAEAATSIDCSQAVAYTLDYETCMSEIASAACSVTELPPSCQDVIKVSQ
jgi:NAD(P)H-hydrate repair Nnr-like enzyme with NAD(P)H-hydrate dehydratase domain